MATYYTFNCTNCTNKISVSGPHEFKFENGAIKALPHPGSHESSANGLYLNAFCPHCEKNQKLIIVEYIDAVENPWEINLENIKKQYRANYVDYIKDHPQKRKIPTECFCFSAIKCPSCKKEMVYYPGNIDKFKCPTCKTGNLMVDDKSLMMT